MTDDNGIKIKYISIFISKNTQEGAYVIGVFRKVLKLHGVKERKYERSPNRV